MAAQPYLTASRSGQGEVVAGQLAGAAPALVVVDEAHNNRTEQAFRTLRNLHPACLIELTATPVTPAAMCSGTSARRPCSARK
jgi:type III restriction enzyme